MENALHFALTHNTKAKWPHEFLRPRLLRVTQESRLSDILSFSTVEGDYTAESPWYTDGRRA